jgi:hypothetical protein
MAAGGDLPRLANLEYKVVFQFEFVRRLSLRPWRILGVLCGSKTLKPKARKEKVAKSAKQENDRDAETAPLPDFASVRASGGVMLMLP